MIQFFKIILYEPLFNLLIFFYNVIPGHDLGVAIIVLTIIIKLILHPLSRGSIKGQRALHELQPKLEEIKKKYAGQKEKQAQAMMEFYRKNKVNPFSSCLPILIQFPILIAVYQVLRVGLNPEAALPLYTFVHNPGQLNAIAFGFLNLAKPFIPLAIITAILQYFQTRMLSTRKPPKEAHAKNGAKDESMMTMMNKQMQFMLPIMTVLIGATLPSGLILYWLISLLLVILEQKIIFKSSLRNTKS